MNTPFTRRLAILPSVGKVVFVLVCVVTLNAHSADTAPPTPSPLKPEPASAKSTTNNPAVPVDPVDIKDLAELKREIRRHLGRQSKATTPVSTVSLDTPYNYWKCAKYYREHEKSRLSVYAAMARDLGHADRLLMAADPSVRRSSVGIADTVITYALLTLKDLPLAVAVCDAYLMPNLDLADSRREQHLSKPHLLATAITAYSKGNEPVKMQRAAELALEDAESLNAKDACRFQIARALQRQKKHAEAIALLKEVTDPALVNGAKDFLSTLEKEREAEKSAPKK